MEKPKGVGIGGRMLGLVLLASLLVSVAPASARTISERPGRSPSTSLQQLGEKLAGYGVPAHFIDRLLAEITFEGTFSYAIPAGDLDRDGTGDVYAVAIDYSITIDDTLFLVTGFEFEGTSYISALSGRSGKRLWKRTYEDFTIPITVDVGPNARRGALLIAGLGTLVGPFEDRYLDIEAVVGAKGKKLWSRTYRSQSVSQGITYSGHNVPLSIDLFNGSPGRSDDVLVGVAEVASAGIAYAIASQAHVIDGRDGQETIHPTVDASVNWYPSPWAVGDLDGDGLDDYVVSTNPAVGSRGQGTVVAGAMVYGRTGIDGEEIWANPNLSLEDVAWVFPLSDVVGDRGRDFAITTRHEQRWMSYAIEGTSGYERWLKPGLWAYSPGDIDRDGRADTVLRDLDFAFGKGEIRYIHGAYDDRGKKIWRRTLRSKYALGPCPGFCSASGGSGFWEFGDVEPDGVVDTFVHHDMEQDPGEDRVFTYVVSGRSGKRTVAGGDELVTLEAALDGRGDDLARIAQSPGALSVTAITGNSEVTLWKTDLAFATKLGHDAYLLATRLQRSDRRCDDTVITVDGGKRSVAIAFDGASGRMKWWHPITGSVEDIRALSNADSNPAC